MKAYLVCFIFTILFTFLAEINFKKEKKVIATFFSIIAIFIPAFICGIRSTEVGRDINIYVSPILKRAFIYDFSAYMNVTNLESGYLVFVYIISKLSSNVNFLLFFIGLIPCISVFIFAYHYRERIPMWFVITTFLLTWYLRGYTMMRQSISVGFILLSIVTFEKKHIFKTIILFILALLFHKSTIIAVGLYLIIGLCNTKKISKRTKITILLVSFLLMCIMIYFYEEILYFLSYRIGILPERFADYLNSQFYSEDLQFSFSETLFRLIFLFLGLLYLMISNKEDNDFIKFYVFFIISIGPYIVSLKVINAERMNYYYYYPALLYIVPSLVKIVKKDKINKIIMSTFLIIILFAFWFFKYPIKKNCETYPYESDILTFLN